MNTLKRFWNWLLGKTTIDEQIVDAYEDAKDKVEDIAPTRARMRRHSAYCSSALGLGRSSQCQSQVGFAHATEHGP